MTACLRFAGPVLPGLLILLMAPGAAAQSPRIVAGQTQGLRVDTRQASFGCSPAGPCEELDLDGDGLNDLALVKRSVSTGQSGGVYFIRAEAKRADLELAGADSATWLATSNRNLGSALPLLPGDSLSDRPLSQGRYVRWNKASGNVMAGASLLFASSPAMGSPGTTSGYWRDTTTYFLGVRQALPTGGYRHGWLRIKGQAMVLSYAFQRVVTSSLPATAPAVHLFPNPVNEQLQIRLPEPVAARVQVYDGLGRRRHSADLAPTRNPQALNLADLPAGVYFVRISTSAGSVTHRLQKL